MFPTTATQAQAPTLVRIECMLAMIVSGQTNAEYRKEVHPEPLENFASEHHF
jgi:hypothetical protein